MPLNAKLLRLVVCAAVLTGCKANADGSSGAPATSTAEAQRSGDDAPLAEKTGGFDGKRAFAHVAKQVGFGPRPSGSAAIGQLQEYIQNELTSYGCKVDTDSFTADTPVGRLPMKNIVAKIPGEKPGIIMLATHYDTKRLENFVGADDGASSTAVMLELARLLCAKPGSNQVWITFFDGEEAVKFVWQDPDNRYGSRQMAAKLAMSGELPKIKAVLLADMVGSRNLRFRREADSTKALTDLIWSTAARLGYSKIFVNESSPTEDDHIIFLKRGVRAVDVINFEIPYWHTVEDTLDKVSAKSVAITGHVLLESVRQLQSK
ncbi:MAG TPA: M28 family peptidase [Candidatus Acidoferrum sp.]